MRGLKVRGKGVVCVLVKRDEGRILLMKRRKYPEESWCYVAGSIEGRERAWETAVREVEEETGLRYREDYSLYSADAMEQLYNIRKDYIWVAPVFAALVHSAREIVINDEHLEYRWVTVEEAGELLSFPEQKRIIRHIDEYFLKDTPPVCLEIK